MYIKYLFTGIVAFSLFGCNQISESNINKELDSLVFDDTINLQSSQTKDCVLNETSITVRTEEIKDADTANYNLLMRSGLFQKYKGISNLKYTFYKIKYVTIDDAFKIYAGDIQYDDSLYRYLQKIPGDYLCIFIDQKNIEYPIYISTYSTPKIKESFAFETNLRHKYLFTSWEDNEALCQFYYILYRISGDSLMTISTTRYGCDI